MIASGSYTLTANGESGNVMSGNVFETINRTGRRVLAAASASTGTVYVDFMLGGNTLASRALIPATNRFPLLDDDLIIAVIGVAGQQIFMNFLEGGGGTPSVKWAIQLL